MHHRGDGTVDRNDGTRRLDGRSGRRREGPRPPHGVEAGSHDDGSDVGGEPVNDHAGQRERSVDASSDERTGQARLDDTDTAGGRGEAPEQMLYDDLF